MIGFDSLDWLDYVDESKGRDDNGNLILRDDAPDWVVEQYEKHLDMRKIGK